MRVYKSVFKDRKTGRPRQTKNWYVEFTKADGTAGRMPALTAKAQSEEFGRKIERLVACRIASTSLDPDLIRWVESLPPVVHQRLLKFNLLDARFVGTVKPLEDHVSDFEAVLRAKNNSDGYVDLLVTRLRTLLTGCEFRHWSDISASGLQKYLAELRKGSKNKRGISNQTSNFYLKAAKQFFRWMHEDRRSGESPISHLECLNVKVDRRHDRRSFTIEEISWLLGTTEKGPTYCGITGQERALLYRMAIETGLRAGELASLTVGALALDTDPPLITVTAGASKHRKQDFLILKKATAAMLKQQFANRLATDIALRVPGKNNRTHILRRDLHAARVAWLADAADEETRAKRVQTDFLKYKDEGGKFLDFHAFRHTTATNLARTGVTPKTAQAIMRHTDINLTMTAYSHSFREDEVQAIENQPDLGLRSPEKRQADTA